MKAIVIDRYGAADVLRLADLPMPKPGRKQVLVHVHYVGVNPKDIIVRKGKFKVMTGKRFPMILGHDIAGEVVEAGPESDLRKGDRVYGMLNNFSGGGYAEYVVSDIDALGKVPDGIDLKTAAAFPLAAQTALQALRDIAHVSNRDEVLINGASGGVGTFAVQIAKVLGARVTAVCSHRNIELVQELGADVVIDYTKTDITSLTERFDTVFDVFGNYDFDALKHLLRKPGCYVQTIPSKKIFLDIVRTGLTGKRARLVLVRSKRKDMDWLSEQIRAGTMKAVLDRTFRIEDVAEAHRHLETKRTRGKVVLELS